MKLKSTGYWFLFCILGAARSASVFSVIKKPKIRVKKVSGLRGAGYEPDPVARSPP